MSYILAKIGDGGYIRTNHYDYFGRRTGIIHKESVGIDSTGEMKVYANLKSAKSEWSGPESDEAILNLDEVGSVSAIWIAETQAERLGERLKIWSGCYGSWPIRRLNT